MKQKKILTPNKTITQNKCFQNILKYLRSSIFHWFFFGRYQQIVERYNVTCVQLTRYGIGNYNMVQSWLLFPYRDFRWPCVLSIFKWWSDNLVLFHITNITHMTASMTMWWIIHTLFTNLWDYDSLQQRFPLSYIWWLGTTIAWPDNFINTESLSPVFSGIRVA
jgi:hypothetical protein